MDSDSKEFSNPFQHQGPIPAERTAMERVRKVSRPDLARAALEHLLASLDPTEISADDVVAIEGRYGLSDEEGRDIRLDLCRHALETFVAKRVITAHEGAYLKRLQLALGLSDEDLVPIRLSVGAPHFRESLKSVAADYAITPAERQHLADLATALGIPSMLAADAVENTARSMLDRIWVAATEGGSLSEINALRVRKASTDLGVALLPAQEQLVLEMERRVAERQRAAEEQARERQRAAEEQARERRRATEEQAREQQRALEERNREREQDVSTLNGLLARLQRSKSLPVVSPTRALDHGEKCHCAQRVRFYQMRPDPHNRYEPHTLSFMDEGTLMLTSKRLIFHGRRILSFVDYLEIVGGVRFTDALRLRRRFDEDLIYFMDLSQRLELVSRILARVKGWSDISTVSSNLGEYG